VPKGQKATAADGAASQLDRSCPSFCLDEEETALWEQKTCQPAQTLGLIELILALQDQYYSLSKKEAVLRIWYRSRGICFFSVCSSRQLAGFS
jgi:hypothetical protein